MEPLIKLASFVKPSWRRAVVSLVLLTAIVVTDLAIPPLIQRIIDQGVPSQNQAVSQNATSLFATVLSTAGLLIAMTGSA